MQDAPSGGVCKCVPSGMFSHLLVVDSGLGFVSVLKYVDVVVALIS